MFAFNQYGFNELLICLLQAKLHGNAPSKGAQIDAELQAEDEERLRQKGIKK
jgi:hypothetical protein